MMQWLRRRMIAGFFVMVPLVISVAALVWIFGIIDGFTAPVSERVLGRTIPGLGLLTTMLVVLLAGILATNVIGRRVLARTESWLMRVPVFRTVYAPVKLKLPRELAELVELKRSCRRSVPTVMVCAPLIRCTLSVIS